MIQFFNHPEQNVCDKILRDIDVAVNAGQPLQDWRHINNTNNIVWGGLKKQTFFSLEQKSNLDFEWLEFQLHVGKQEQITKEEYIQLHCALIQLLMTYYQQNNQIAIPHLSPNNYDVKDNI